MDLIVLGAAPSFTDRAGSAASCYLLVERGEAIVLDLGQGAFPSLAAAREPSALLTVVISHLHPDHFIDLVPLRHYLRYQWDPPRRLAVLAPAALATRLDALNGEPGFTAASLDVAPLSAGRRQIGPFAVEAGRVAHTNESYAFRVAPAGRAAGGPATGLVYSGDCGSVGDLAALIRPGDTLLAEVSFGPGPVPAGVPHLAAPEVGSLAASSGAARLLLTHLQMGFDPAATVRAAARHFAGEVRVVTEGDRLSI